MVRLGTLRGPHIVERKDTKSVTEHPSLVAVDRDNMETARKCGDPPMQFKQEHARFKTKNLLEQGNGMIAIIPSHNLH